jgi:hypothetical protein
VVDPTFPGSYSYSLELDDEHDLVKVVADRFFHSFDNKFGFVFQESEQDADASKWNTAPHSFWKPSILQSLAARCSPWRDAATVPSSDSGPEARDNLSRFLRNFPTSFLETALIDLDGRFSSSIPIPLTPRQRTSNIVDQDALNILRANFKPDEIREFDKI